ncbi:MAG: triphosphoribosyl-dephospho-CoA synthase [Halodesulfurarchaeum sp.]
MTGRSPAQQAELALLLEVAGTPKPGNVDRERDLADLHFEHFLAGAVGARPGLNAASEGEALGPAFLRAVEGMSEQSGGNTQFGALLLLVPLVAATGEAPPTPESVTDVVRATTVSDAVAFYRAFDVVDVRVGDPPAAEDGPDVPDVRKGSAAVPDERRGSAAVPDVRKGSAAVPEVERAGYTLYDLMEISAGTAEGDLVAREWTTGFERSFEVASRIEGDEGPVTDRAARAFLWLLGEHPDSLIVIAHGRERAAAVAERARSLRSADEEAIAAFADDLVEAGINPGATADVVAAALYIALARGLSV